MSSMEWNDHRYLCDAFRMILQEAKLRNVSPTHGMLHLAVSR